MSAGTPPAAWRRLAPHYDRQLWLERAAVRHAVVMLAPAATERVLDIGTGTGAVLRELAGRPDPPQAVTGVDREPAMLARVPPLPAGWELGEADAGRLPFPDHAFGAVVAAYVLHVLPGGDLAPALAEAHRVLCPGGRVVTVTPAIPRCGATRAVALAADRIARHRPGRFGGLRALDPRAALREAGFTLLRARWSLRGYPSLIVLAGT